MYGHGSSSVSHLKTLHLLEDPARLPQAGEMAGFDHTVTSRQVDSTDTVTAFNECACLRAGRGATPAN